MANGKGGNTSEQAQGLKGSTLFITNLIKLGGLAFAINEIMLRAELRPLAVAIAALCMAGAQVSEDMLLSVLDSFLGRKGRLEEGRREEARQGGDQ